MCLDGECNIDIALSEYLDLSTLLGEPRRTHRFRCHRRSCIEFTKATDIDHGELFAVWILETLELGYPTLQRGLTALKTLTDLASGLETLGAATSSLASTTSLTAPGADLSFLGTSAGLR